MSQYGTSAINVEREKQEKQKKNERERERRRPAAQYIVYARTCNIGQPIEGGLGMGVRIIYATSTHM